MGLTDRFAALEAVKKKHVAPGKQDELVAQYAHEAAAFVEENDLVTVPPLCKELWDVRMIAPENLDRLPYALYRGKQRGGGLCCRCAGTRREADEHARQQPACDPNRHGP